MKTLVIIPARAGSKGIKNKNLRKINNTSLVENTFKLASKLKNIDDIIVSTDSKKIIKISKKFTQYIVYKGSISINGISLTVSKIINNGFEVAIIPHTLKSTNLIYLKITRLFEHRF